MAEVEKTFRLSKAIKEFNLSLDHIVDFLTKKGFKVESNPNTKLPGDAYALLLKEFQGDKSAKEEAQQLAQNKMRKESVVLDAQEKPKAASKKDDDSSEILIKNVGAATAPKEEAPKAVVHGERLADVQGLPAEHHEGVESVERQLRAIGGD